MTRRPTPIAGRWVVVVVAVGLVVAACGPISTPTGSAPAADRFADWDEVLAAADGQEVALWMWGGDDVLNSYVEDEVVPRLRERGVRLTPVRLDATEDGLDRIVSEIEAGSDAGAVDLLWVNGKNFVQGKEAGLWREDWVRDLPNADLLDPDDPTLFSDFGVPTEGQEAPWSRAAFTFAHDEARLPDPPRSFDELAAWVRVNPGRFTYPAPPDFTGSAFVRQAVQALGEEDAFELLAAIDGGLWSAGATYPRDETELNRLFADGEVDLAMSYNPNFVEINVGTGRFPPSARPYVFEGGTLQNVSFLAIPSNASSAAGAMVTVDELLSVELQALKFELVGVPPVVDIGPAAAGSPLRLADFGPPLTELPADEVPRLDQRWRREILVS